jgi:pimeloyl-ACP methyl ester carboxylesterase
VTRRSALWISFAVSAVLLVVLSAIDLRLWDEGGPGIVGFELAWEGDEVDRILAEWGSDGRDAANLSLWLDFPFLVAYGVFWALAARPSRLWVLAPLAAGFDVLENVVLMIELGGAGWAGLPVLAGLFATVKFAALAGVVGAVLLRLARRFPPVAAGLLAIAIAALVLNAVVAERETVPADPDIGQIVRLPAGDVQMRIEGPRGAPPVVLIHGFSASMRWWDAVTPALARSLRVVRIDLLGHGGSEKPRHGYSIENQAELVAQAMREAGVRRAAVVGHSMGGMVGTALAERHRPMVTRLMLIGTAADGDDAPAGLLDRAAFWPVVGHANDRLVSERAARWAVERGFAPEFDPPRRLARDIFGRTTWNAFKDSGEAIGRFWDEAPLHERLARAGRVPVTVLLGEEERHTRRSVPLYNSIPSARTVVMQGLDHSPQVEAPDRTAPLIEAFARGR